MTIIQKRYNDEKVLTMDMELCYRVWCHHHKKGEESAHNVDLPDHPMVGKRLCRLTDGHIYKVQSVHKQWYAGWYIAILLERNQSHHLLYWENLGCVSDLIVADIEENRLQYYQVPENAIEAEVIFDYNEVNS